jgi:hypothetical protein
MYKMGSYTKQIKFTTNSSPPHDMNLHFYFHIPLKTIFAKVNIPYNKGYTNPLMGLSFLCMVSWQEQSHQVISF